MIKALLNKYFTSKKNTIGDKTQTDKEIVIKLLNNKIANHHIAEKLVFKTCCQLTNLILDHRLVDAISVDNDLFNDVVDHVLYQIDYNSYVSDTYHVFDNHDEGSWYKYTPEERAEEKRRRIKEKNLIIKSIVSVLYHFNKLITGITGKDDSISYIKKLIEMKIYGKTATTKINDINKLKQITLQSLTPSIAIIPTIELTKQVKSGSRGSLPLAKIKDAFEKDRDFEIVISYTGENECYHDNIAIDIDLDGIEAKKHDNAVAYHLHFSKGFPLEYNEPFILTGRRTIVIASCKLVDSEVIDGTSTTIYKIFIRD